MPVSGRGGHVGTPKREEAAARWKHLWMALDREVREVAAPVIGRQLVAAGGPRVRRFLHLVGHPHTNGEIHPIATSGSCEDRLRTPLAAVSAELSARILAYFLGALEGH